ncbi:MAG: hypothetical protein B7Y25_00045 [Alphaproteobacteria bacterium 16-39-46]|nr:MAG: hypothetical protein B7Y25_00045 [Alphaproteobacteria bacterium 16-39-46]OZA44552.1 MAG: hypothetical protein B7X84_00275 [Alphaproteobacteria bacterium 17-39-52]HQS83401.1 NUDIX domain-containing protein [Alphaproteobacteria bacterium]HQS93088.1 NUDIX domain-containing protein [Alphaproteobacteria bacterium]
MNFVLRILFLVSVISLSFFLCCDARPAYVCIFSDEGGETKVLLAQKKVKGNWFIKHPESYITPGSDGKWVTITKDDGSRTFAVYSSGRKIKCPNSWVFPGGDAIIREGEHVIETGEKAAKREFREETGVSLLKITSEYSKLVRGAGFDAFYVRVRPDSLSSLATKIGENFDLNQKIRTNPLEMMMAQNSPGTLDDELEEVQVVTKAEAKTRIEHQIPKKDFDWFLWILDHIPVISQAYPPHST